MIMEKENRFNKEMKGDNMEGLFKKGALKYADHPEDNPHKMDFFEITLSLIEHDYPAKTPVMWNAAYRAFGMNSGNVMAVGNTENIPDIFHVFRNDSKYLGGGAGVGFKDEAVKFLDEVEPIAKEIGAVNFIAKTPEGKLRGYNTDGLGYASSLKELFEKGGEDLQGKKAVLLGSGGTGNAIAFMLAKEGVRLAILNRTTAKAETLAEKINSYFNLEGDDRARFGGEDLIEEEIADADAVVNVSTKGAKGRFEKYSALAPAVTPVTDESLKKNLDEAKRILSKISSKTIISDVVLRDGETPLISSAKLAGFKTLNGIPMVVYQGVEAFWILHRKEMERKGITKEKVAEIMKKAAGFE